VGDAVQGLVEPDVQASDFGDGEWDQAGVVGRLLVGINGPDRDLKCSANALLLNPLAPTWLFCRARPSHPYDPPGTQTRHSALPRQDQKAECAIAAIVRDMQSSE